MPIEPNYQTFTVDEPLGALTAQTAVECKLPVPSSEIARVLSVSTRVIREGAEALSGEFRFSGKVLFFVVYADREGVIKKSECGVEFQGNGVGEGVLPSTDLCLEMRAENVKFRPAGDSLYLTAIVTAEAQAWTPREFRYLFSCENMTVKREEVSFLSFAGVIFGESGENASFDEDTAIGDVLSYYAAASVKETEAGVGAVTVSGETAFTLLIKTQDGILPLEKKFPFRIELEENECMPGCTVTADVSVREVHFSVTADREKNTSRVDAEFGLSVCGALYKESTAEFVTDGFLPDRETAFTRESVLLLAPGKSREATLRIAQKATAEKTEGGRVIAVLPENITVTDVSGKAGAVAVGGILSASVFFAEDGAVKALSPELPFTAEIPFPGAEAGKKYVVRLFIESVSAEFLSGEEGGLALTATVRAVCTEEVSQTLAFITEAEEGETRPALTGAVTVCFAEKGAGLWELSKSLGVPPEEVMKNNPELRFPTEGSERILIYKPL